MKINFQRQAGATLIEIIMVVALIAIITIGALVYYNTAQQGSRVSEAVSGITALSAVVRNQFSTQGDYTGVTSDVVAMFGGVPASMISGTASAKKLRHPWNAANNAVTIATGTFTTAGDSFVVTFNGVPAAVCGDLISKTYKHFVAVGVGSTVSRTTGLSGVSAITTACAGTADISISFMQR